MRLEGQGWCPHHPVPASPLACWCACLHRPFARPCHAQNAYAMRKVFPTGEKAAADKAAAAAEKAAVDKQQTPEKAGAAARKGGKRR